VFLVSDMSFGQEGGPYKALFLALTAHKLFYPSQVALHLQAFLTIWYKLTIDKLAIEFQLLT